jgi:hypothetical protein
MSDARMEEIRIVYAYRIFVWKPEGKWPLECPSGRREGLLLEQVLGKWGLGYELD